jgi:HEPN domain-containing protein
MKKETEEWIRIAEEDFQAAEYLFETCLFTMVCYHAQQFVEKMLKAILVEKEIEFSRTHNMLDLCNAVKKIGHESPLAVEEAIFLNSVYRAGYPAALGLLPTGEPTKEDAERALHRMHEKCGSGLERFWLVSLLAC